MADLIIDLITTEGITLADTSFPSETLVRAFVSELVDLLGLPRHQEDYSLFWEKQKITLDNERSLAECGVRNGDRVRLVSSVKVAAPEDASIPGEVPNSDKGVEVRLALPDLNTIEDERLDRDIRVEDLIRLLVSKYQLQGYDNRPPESSFLLRSKYWGKFLPPADTVRELGILKHDTITLVRHELSS